MPSIVLLCLEFGSLNSVITGIRTVDTCGPVATVNFKRAVVFVHVGVQYLFGHMLICLHCTWVLPA